MRTTQAEFEEWRRKKRAKDPKERRKAGEAAKRGSDAKTLVGKPEWEWFVRHVDALLTRRTDELQQVQDQLVSEGPLMTREKIQRLRDRGIYLQSQVSLLRIIVALPAQMIQQGEAGLAALKAFDDEPDGDKAA